MSLIDPVARMLEKQKSRQRRQEQKQKFKERTDNYAYKDRKKPEKGSKKKGAETGE
jgi:hypothetical protein